MTHRSTEFGLGEQRFLGDGVVTGHGTIDGRLVFIFSQDFTVFGGSLSEAYAEKICKVMDLAMSVGAPVIGLNDSGGARIQEGVASLGGYADIFLRNVLASGVVPQISVIMGPCAGGAVYSPAMTDFTIMVERTSYMFVTGPNVVKAVTHEEVDSEALGGATVHTTKSGVAHLAAHDEAEALDAVRRILAHLPQNNLEIARDRAGGGPGRSDGPGARPTSSPTIRTGRTTCTTSSRGSSTTATFLEIQPGWAANIIIGFARFGGPQRRDRRAAAVGPRRRARHRRLDEGGPVRPDVRLLQRPAGDPRRRAGLPARGGAGAWRDHQARREAAVRLLRGDGPQGDRHHPQGLRRRLRRHEQQARSRRHELRLADRRDRGDGRRGRREHHLQGRDRRGRRSGGRAERLVAEYEDEFANPYIAAARGYVDAVIRPSETRPRIIRALEMLADKRDTNPRKKHGNIPL